MNDERSIGELMHLMHRASRIISPSSLIDAGTIATPLQMDALLFLHSHPKSAARSLADYLSISTSATSQLIDRLTSVGFIKRESSMDDRRVILLSLTNKGRKIFMRLRKIQLESKREILKLIPTKDVNELIRIFSNLLHTLESQEENRKK